MEERPTAPISAYHFDDFEYRREDMTENKKQDRVEDKILEILKGFETNRALVLTGDTGCGKTTQIPKLLMNRFKNIICTQPRRLAVINTAKHISQNLNCALGSIVGYTIRYENVTCQDTVLRIVTDGILLNEITRKDINILKYDLIIIDEAHERSLNIDFILGYCKNILLKDVSSVTRVLIMSATLHTKKFIRYFNCPLIEIQHMRYNIDHFYLKEDLYSSRCVVEYCVQTAMNIVMRDPNAGGDILIFLPGQADIDRAYQLLSEGCREDLIHNVTILKLFSLLPKDEQNLVFLKETKGRRKIILSTNIAETSMTIQNIQFIIDSGKVKIMQKSLSTQSLVVKNISKAQAKQRAGRAGRTQPGVVYRIYSHNFYDVEMEEDQKPEILRSNLNSIVLSLKKIGVDNISTFEFIDEPLPSLIWSTVNFLKALGVLNYSRETLTRIGQKISNIPLDTEMAVSLYAAHRLRCINSVSIIIAFLNHPNFFKIVKSNLPHYKQYLDIKSKWNHEKGDFYTFLNIYNSWVLSGFQNQFLESNYLNPNAMNNIKKEHHKLLNLFPKPRQCDNMDNIERAFCNGFFKNVAKRIKDDDQYTNQYELLMDGSDDCEIDKRDGLYERNPRFILFIQLNLTNGMYKYMRYCLEINESLYDFGEKKCIAYNLKDT